MESPPLCHAEIAAAVMGDKAVVVPEPMNMIPVEGIAAGFGSQHVVEAFRRGASGEADGEACT
ncbi:MAG TPA: hypothetical protein VKC66_00820 [Xanthobacteraceae bacterium]|nr:hypothetical protein [Xanthobacteraceae bacterium]